MATNASKVYVWYNSNVTRLAHTDLLVCKQQTQGLYFDPLCCHFINDIKKRSQKMQFQHTLYVNGIVEYTFVVLLSITHVFRYQRW